jgi:hypothetical protein
MQDVMKQRQVPNFLDAAPWFVGTFSALREVMTEMESHTINSPSSRPSTSESGGSLASKHETNVQELCKLLIRESLTAMGNSLQYISWDPNNLMFDARSCSPIY